MRYVQTILTAVLNEQELTWPSQINRHKMTTVTPAYHMEAYGVDDNRFDMSTCCLEIYLRRNNPEPLSEEVIANSLLSDRAILVPFL
jgi:hypothetical protein